MRFDIIKAHIFDSKIWIHCYELEIGLHSKKIDLYSHNYRHIYIRSALVNVKRGLYWTISRWLKTILKAEWRLLWENILVRMVFVVKQM